MRARRYRTGALRCGIAVAPLVAVFAVVASGHAAVAQGPSDAGVATTDAGIGDSVYACAETIPKGAARPMVTDTFPTRGTSGWAAALSVTVRHGKGERVLPSGLDLTRASEARKGLKDTGFAIPDQDGGAGARVWTDADDAKDSAGTSSATTHFELPLVLLPQSPGRSVMTLPPLPIAVARANGEIATVCTQAHAIIVDDPTSNTPEAMPKGNPPGLVQREEWTALRRAVGWTALGLVVGGIIAVLLWRWLTAPKPPPPPPPPRPPWDVALEQLDEVRHAGLLDAERYGEHFDRTSDAVRRYLGARFGFDGLESTTDEILNALRRRGGGFIRFEPEGDAPLRAFGPAPGVALERIADFLRECDLVKFANLTPTSEQCSRSISTGEAIVRSTMPTSMGMPVEIPPPAPAAPAAPAPPPKPARSPYEPPEPTDVAAPVSGESAPLPDDRSPKDGES